MKITKKQLYEIIASEINKSAIDDIYMPSTSSDYRYAKSEYDRTFASLKQQLFVLTNREYN